MAFVTGLKIMMHLCKIFIVFIITTHVLRTPVSVVNGENEESINCPDGCEVSSNYSVSSDYVSSNFYASRLFHCPFECMCVLGNQNVSIICANETSSTQVLYPSSVTSLSWSETGIHGIEENAFKDVPELAGIIELDLSTNYIAELHPQQFEGLVYLEWSG